MSHRRSPSLSSKNHGFTIVELLIATAIFSVILLLVSFAILQISRTYYKGINESTTQDTARTALDTITQDIQYNSGAVSFGPSSGGTFVICVGNNQYTANMGKEVVDSSSSHALLAYSDISGGCAVGTPVPIGATSSTELLAPFMRLANLQVTNPPGSTLYTVEIRVVYGDDDLLCSALRVAGSCSSPTTMPLPADFVAPDLTCKPLTGNQYCAVSDLTATVDKRINQ